MERNRKVDHLMCGSRPCGGCRVHLSALLVAIRNACSSCSSLSSVASRAELHMAAVRQPTDTVGRRCGWSASTEHTRPSQLWSSSFSASSCIESSSLCTWSRSPARRLPRLPRSPRWRRHWRPVGADLAGRRAVPSSRRPCLRCRCLRARSGWLRRQGAVLVVLLVEPVLQPIGAALSRSCWRSVPILI